MGISRQTGLKLGLQNTSLDFCPPNITGEPLNHWPRFLNASMISPANDTSIYRGSLIATVYIYINIAFPFIPFIDMAMQIIIWLANVLTPTDGYSAATHIQWWQLPFGPPKRAPDCCCEAWVAVWCKDSIVLPELMQLNFDKTML